VKRPALLTAALLLAALPLCADTIYQINALGKRMVIQRQAIVIQNDSTYVVYKHFDLKDQRVERVRLDQGSLPYQVETSPPAERQQIVSIWKAFGFHGTVTGAAGKTTRVYDLYIDFYPPGGRGSLLEAVPAVTSVALLLDGGGADVLPFSRILSMVFQGPELRVTLRNGQVETGRFLMPTQQPAEARLLGITDQYDPSSADVFDFSMPLARLKEVHFQH
jgi:hypothetical protein